MNKNIIKAKVYSKLGTVIWLLALAGIVGVCLSTAFITSNIIIRLIWYIILTMFIILGAKLSAYGKNFLNKKFGKVKRRR